MRTKKLQFLMQFNPLYQFLTATRTIVLYEQMPSGITLLILFAIGLVTLLFGAIVFKKNQDKYIYYV